MDQQTAPVTIRSMTQVLVALASLARVQQIQIIGSVAREDEGKDLDVVLVVDHYTYASYLAYMWRNFGLYGSIVVDDFYMSYTEARYEAAMAVLKATPRQIDAIDEALQLSKGSIDVQVMPVGWLNRIAEIQTHLPHDDANFVKKIAADARTLRTSIVQGQVIVSGMDAAK